MKFLWIAFILYVFRQGACDAVCTEPGRFPNNTRDDCRGYVMCLKGATTITHYNLVCPEHSVYSHVDNQCTNVTSYQCFTNYTCPHEGNFLNDLDENCLSYISCVQDLNQIVSARIIKCPEERVFSAKDNVCVNSTSYECIREIPNDLNVSLNNTEVTENSSGGANCISVSLSFIVYILQLGLATSFQFGQ